MTVNEEKMMKFDFFTLGGGYFWEDVFFYQKWRIQRNYSSKNYRLLDPWDIRRHEGSFEECRKAFVKFIEVYEISRQRGHMVIMLHGLTDTKNIFKPLWRAVLQNNLMAAAINYPSTLKHVDAHVRQLDFLLNNLEDVSEISFVTKGIGGIILRKLLSKKSPWQENLKIKRIVQVSPPNKGSRFFGKLGEYRIFRWIFGPVLGEVTPNNIANIPEFPKKYEVGVIYCDYPLKNLATLLPLSFRKALPKASESDLKTAKETVYIKNMHFNVFNNKKVVSAVVNFLKMGKFS